MAEKADHPCPCTHPELPQFQWVSKIYPIASKVLKALHTNKGILTDTECGQCASENYYWFRLIANVVATKPPDVVQQTLDVVREQSPVKHHPDLEQLARLLKVLSTLYQEKMVTEQEVEELKQAVWPWSCLFCIQCKKPPDVVTRAAELLAEVGRNEEANLLRVLVALHQKEVITQVIQHDLHKGKGGAQNMLLNLILDQYTKPPEDVATTANVMDMFRFQKEAKVLRSLSVLHQKKMIAHNEVEDMCLVVRERLKDPLGQDVMKIHGVGETLCQKLVNVQSSKPPVVVTTTADVLYKLGLKEEATQLRDSTKYASLKPLLSSASLEMAVKRASHYAIEEQGPLSKQPLVEQSQLTSSLGELTVSPPKTKVSSLKVGGGSDPLEREDTSVLLIDEPALKRLCWVPFGVKTLPIEPKGGTLYLQPLSDEYHWEKENTIFIEVPPGAVSTSADVEMRCAIIPSGSFALLEGYHLGSPVVYIYYNSRRVTKPLKLHLPHWYGGEDHVQDGLSFAVASHSLRRGMTVYQFQLILGGTFSLHQQYGTFHIDGHSSLFAVVFKEKATSVYLATQWEQRLASETCTKIVITYYSKVWLEILEKYWVNWERNKAATEDFQFGRRLFSKCRVCGELPKVQGQDWKVTLVGSEVHKDSVCYFNRFTESSLEGLVEMEVYPPAVKCSVLYSSPRNFERPSLESFDMKIAGTTKHHVSFPIKVYSAIVSPPTPTPDPAQAETTSQSSTSLWAAAALPPIPMSIAQRTLAGTAGDLSVCSPPARVTASPLDPLDQRPTLKDLNEKVIVRVAGKWFTTGLHLDITSDTLDAIRTPNGSNREHCLEMFKCWLAGEQGSGDLPRTWSNVLHAVENGCGSEVYQEIAERLNQET